VLPAQGELPGLNSHALLWFSDERKPFLDEYRILNGCARLNFVFFLVGGNRKDGIERRKAFISVFLGPKDGKVFSLSAFGSHHTKNDQRACWLRGRRCARRTEVATCKEKVPLFAEQQPGSGQLLYISKMSAFML
jgi:hypothetical protein